MPKDSIERAVVKGKSGGSTAYNPVTYEVYGPGSVAVIVTALTDNKNRTAQDVRIILSKHSCSLATQGSALWAFSKAVDGSYTPTTTTTIQDTESEALQKLIDDLEDNDDVQHVYTNAL